MPGHSLLAGRACSEEATANRPLGSFPGIRGRRALTLGAEFRASPLNLRVPAALGGLACAGSRACERLSLCSFSAGQLLRIGVRSNCEEDQAQLVSGLFDLGRRLQVRAPVVAQSQHKHAQLASRKVSGRGVRSLRGDALRRQPVGKVLSRSTPRGGFRPSSRQ